MNLEFDLSNEIEDDALMNDSDLQPGFKIFGMDVVDVESLNDPVLPSVDPINEHEHRVISLLTQDIQQQIRQAM